MTVFTYLMQSLLSFINTIWTLFVMSLVGITPIQTPMLLTPTIAPPPPSIRSTTTPVTKEHAPPPLRKKESPSVRAQLTVDGVIRATNRAREQQKLPLLLPQTQLASAALHKAEDMLNRQYFSHDAPTGERAADLAKNAGYEFLAIGENLALGNFDDDVDLVNSWMQSKGHRENILSATYTEIGVAVLHGTFEGKKTWVAVQIFGLPASTCPKPNATSKSEIEHAQQQLEQYKLDIQLMSQELERLKSEDPDAYNNMVGAYNELIDRYNTLARGTKTRIDEYNMEVHRYNTCVNAVSK